MGDPTGRPPGVRARRPSYGWTLATFYFLGAWQRWIESPYWGLAYFAVVIAAGLWVVRRWER